MIYVPLVRVMTMGSVVPTADAATMAYIGLEIHIVSSVATLAHDPTTRSRSEDSSDCRRLPTILRRRWSVLNIYEKL